MRRRNEPEPRQADQHQLSRVAGSGTEVGEVASKEVIWKSAMNPLKSPSERKSSCRSKYPPVPKDSSVWIWNGRG